jgi:hypothetical protein
MDSPTNQTMNVCNYITVSILLCAYDANLLEDNIQTIKENKEALTEASKGVGLDVKAEKTKYSKTWL